MGQRTSRRRTKWEKNEQKTSRDIGQETGRGITGREVEINGKGTGRGQAKNGIYGAKMRRY